MSYKISEQDKEVIEQAAVNLLFEGDPARRALWQQYSQSQQESAVAFRGLDRVCVMWRCLDFAESGRYAYKDFDPYWNYWSPATAQQKLPALVANIYVNDLWPRAEALRLKNMP